jgi:ferredoxin-NADP reductase
MGISPFKQNLQTVKPGDKMYVSKYGNDYGFQLRDNKSSVLIAGGIGIAPFRSMLKEMFDTNTKDDVQLIYLSKNEDFLFKDELDGWRRDLPNLSIDYVVTKELKRKAREKTLLSLISDTARNYFIAGPEAMVESTEHLLLNNGVNIKDIRIDSFGTY